MYTRVMAIITSSMATTGTPTVPRLVTRGKQIGEYPDGDDHAAGTARTKATAGAPFPLRAVSAGACGVPK